MSYFSHKKIMRESDKNNNKNDKNSNKSNKDTYVSMARYVKCYVQGDKIIYEINISICIIIHISV